MVVTVLLALLLPLSTAPLIGAISRETLERALERTLHHAAERYRISSGLHFRQREGTSDAEKSAVELARIGRERRAVRLEIAALRKFLDDSKHERGINFSNDAQVAKVIDTERAAIGEYLRYLSARGMLGNPSGESLLERVRRSLVFGAAPKERIDGRSLAAARSRLYAFLISAREAPIRLAALEKEHTVLSASYMKTLRAHEQALRTARVSEAQFLEIQRITAEVHADVLRLQGELARIDARLQRKAERALIEKGLMEARPGTHADGKLPASALGFRWPVFGPVSAGFHNEDYASYFGVPHDGMDIVVPMETSVRSAADGIVFLTRDGGETGYSYILIGHRGGYATLYGHLSTFTVTSGEEISAGDIIGESGGEPGTHGAGPMTTGAHLHFEVILNGENVDPKEVLP